MSDASDSGGFEGRQTRVDPFLGSLVGTKPPAMNASAFTVVRNLEGYLQGKDDGDV
jgi:hypothetical protein